MDLTATEKRLLNDFQRDFPLEPRPYARIADAIGISEDAVLEMLAGFAERGVLSRVGAVVRPNTAGASTLAAIRVPADRLDDVAALLSAQPEVTHNYEREHEINLWFVVTAADETAVRAALERIGRLCGLPVLDLPLEESFHIDLGFPL